MHAMADDLYLEGDPGTDSTRRHMERVLRGERRPRWPWLLGALAWRDRASRSGESAAGQAGRARDGHAAHGRRATLG